MGAFGTEDATCGAVLSSYFAFSLFAVAELVVVRKEVGLGKVVGTGKLLSNSNRVFRQTEDPESCMISKRNNQNAIIKLFNRPANTDAATMAFPSSVLGMVQN